MSEKKSATIYSQYDDPARTERIIAQGQHRNLIGGKWDEVGNLQLEFLKAAGLSPDHVFLDVGCGCLRLGVKIIPYLNAKNYFGIDAEKKLLDLGYKTELEKVGMREKLPRKNLYCSRLFKHERLPTEHVDYGICVSVMTHLPQNFIRICLENTAQYFKKGGKLYMTFFEIAEEAAFTVPYKNPEGFTTVAFKDPYHYYRRDMEHAAKNTAWKFEYIGDWSHPRGQKIVLYEKQ